jgi:hypothetical protein
MLQTLNKISGAIVGSVIYPIKSAIINTALFAGTILFATFFILTFPIFVATDVYRKSATNKLANAILIGIGMGLLTCVVGILLTLVILAAEIVLGVSDLIRSFGIGIFDGYEKGLFFDTLNEFVFNFSRFSIVLGFVKYLIEITDEPFAQDIPDEAELTYNLDREDAFHPPEDIHSVVSNKEPPLNEEAYAALIQETGPEVAFLPLSTKELELVQGRKAINIIIDNYISLDARLTKLDAEIEKRKIHASEQKIEEAALTLDSDLDEIMASDIVQPILVVQMFEVSPEQWSVVPASTKIACDLNLQQWLCGVSGVYPPTNEPINHTLPYMGKKTKYVITPYTNKKDSKELVDATNLIRGELNKNGEENLSTVGIRAVSQFSDQLSQMFFGGKADEGSVSSEHAATAKI